MSHEELVDGLDSLDTPDNALKEVIVEVPLPDGTYGRYTIQSVTEDGAYIVLRP